MGTVPEKSWERALSATQQFRSLIADGGRDPFVNTPLQRLPTLDRLAHHPRRRAPRAGDASGAELFREFVDRCFPNKTAVFLLGIPYNLRRISNYRPDTPLARHPP